MSVVLWVSGLVDTRSEVLVVVSRLWYCVELGDTVLLSFYLCLLHCTLYEVSYTEEPRYWHTVGYIPTPY